MDQGGLLNIRYETLGEAQSDLAAACAAAQATIEELKSKLAGGLSLWTGTARDAYDKAKYDWDTAFTHMNAVLNKANIHLGNVNDWYQHAERQNVSIWHPGG
jgi:WXG100 family type VII secretion target